MFEEEALAGLTDRSTAKVDWLSGSRITGCCLPWVGEVLRDVLPKRSNFVILRVDDVTEVGDLKLILMKLSCPV